MMSANRRKNLSYNNYIEFSNWRQDVTFAQNSKNVI